MFKLAANEEKIIKTAFAKKSNAVLVEEIEGIQHCKTAALKSQPGLDVSDFDYYIQLRKDAMK